MTESENTAAPESPSFFLLSLNTLQVSKQSTGWPTGAEVEMASPHPTAPEGSVVGRVAAGSPRRHNSLRCWAWRVAGLTAPIARPGMTSLCSTPSQL